MTATVIPLRRRLSGARSELACEVELEAEHQAKLAALELDTIRAELHSRRHQLVITIEHLRKQIIPAQTELRCVVVELEAAACRALDVVNALISQAERWDHPSTSRT